MSRVKKAVVSFFLIVSLFISPVSVQSVAAANDIQDEQNSPEAMTVDLVLCRPLGFVAMLGGTLIFVISSPFSALGGNVDEAWDSLVVTPAEYTFKRPLGEFE